MMPVNWPNALSDLISILQSPPFTNMPQDKIFWIQLEVLTSIPEEVVNGNIMFYFLIFNCLL